MINNKGICKNPYFLSDIADKLIQGETTQELLVASSGFNEVVAYLLYRP
ncbi:hypothetical protein [Sulfurimonas sp. CS5]